MMAQWAWLIAALKREFGKDNILVGASMDVLSVSIDYSPLSGFLTRTTFISSSCRGFRYRGECTYIKPTFDTYRAICRQFDWSRKSAAQFHNTVMV